MAKSKLDLKNETERQHAQFSADNVNPEDPIFSSAYHKFMEGLLKKRDVAIKDEFIHEIKAINAIFHDDLLRDVVKVMEDQWERILKEKLSDMLDEKLIAYGKLRDYKLLKWLVITALLTFILSVISGVAITIWYHNHYLIIPISQLWTSFV